MGVLNHVTLSRKGEENLSGPMVLQEIVCMCVHACVCTLLVAVSQLALALS